MLGCVVSLTSSHLSGSTIRDVNNGGSVLCSNSSFSSLLSSCNTDPNSSEGTITISGQYLEKFVDGKPYSFNYESGPSTSSVVITNCHFTGAKYQSNTRPLTFSHYNGTISIESCSFDNIAQTEIDGGAVSVYISLQFNRTCLTLNSSNFTNCSSKKFGGALHLRIADELFIMSCRFDSCSSILNKSFSSGGGIFVERITWSLFNPLFRFFNCIFADCVSAYSGGGLHVQGDIELSVVNTKFERCVLISEWSYAGGGGMKVYGLATVTVEGSHFIRCSCRGGGSGLHFVNYLDLNISDTLMQGCHSETAGAIFLECYDSSQYISFSHLLFDGNSVGNITAFFSSDKMKFEENATKFTDVAIMCTFFKDTLTFKIDDCSSTVSPDSSGMILRGAFNESSGLNNPERVLDPLFHNIGPLLTAKPTGRVNEQTGKIELEMKGMTPPISQEYEVILKVKWRRKETRLRMLFLDGTGTIVSPSAVDLKYNTGCTIISIVGVVPEPSSSSSSRMTNDIEVPVAAWVFNLGATPDFLSFTTPRSPSYSTLHARLVALTTSLPATLVIVIGIVAGLIYGFASRPSNS
ncbi:hypothetical protein BLNAU_16307 [Blattamonas nauphoetae]|uniref:Right handed beta helix domain-containing protein n=1 Tax=Blattamonas nauphoetae TaxID=2049346 RepID=A0ABQ9X8G0_9EUKA|nr:hypothetical protein BLNAU_16307 [Blattamonas nauphoetae]